MIEYTFFMADLIISVVANWRLDNAKSPAAMLQGHHIRFASRAVAGRASPSTLAHMPYVRTYPR